MISRVEKWMNMSLYREVVAVVLKPVRTTIYLEVSLSEPLSIASYASIEGCFL